MHRQLTNYKLYLMILCDALIFGIAYAVAYLLRFDFSLEPDQLANFRQTLIWIIPLKTVIFSILGLYRGMWRYTSIRDLWLLFYATFFSMLLIMAIILYLYRFYNYSRAVYLMDALMTLFLAGGLRLGIRMYFASSQMHGLKIFGREVKNEKPIFIIGAGDAGEKIFRELSENNRLQYHVVGFIDDDPHKQGRSIHGAPVLGTVENMPYLTKKWDVHEVLIAIPSAKGERMRQIVETCKQCRLEYKTLPGMGEIINGHVSVKDLRDVNYEDLLGRPAVRLDRDEISHYLHGRTLLITGCGGSIGSELCRQAIRFQPERLILVDSCEENLFTIEMELRREFNYSECYPILGHIQDRGLMNDVFLKYRPQVVFHAAAYKHVPMLEQNPWEAIVNNIEGSQAVMETALAHKVESFVLVSTDKAVRPTNVMGATKRVVELIMQSLHGRGTKFVAVRFGNVIGSSGSVIPIFRRQIEHGGPVTVTHPDVTRYFMTIPEAAQLIIQAGAMGEGGEIFILEMGTPVRIADMARDLIRLSGKEPEEDIEIVFTGLRDGEKLCEELITSGEEILETRHDKIMVLMPDALRKGQCMDGDSTQELNDSLQELFEAAGRHDGPAIKQLLLQIVCDYTPQETKSNL